MPRLTVICDAVLGHCSWEACFFLKGDERGVVLGKRGSGVEGLGGARGG